MNIDKVEYETLRYHDAKAYETLLQMREDYLRYKQICQSRINSNKTKKITKKTVKKKIIKK